MCFCFLLDYINFCGKSQIEIEVYSLPFLPYNKPMYASVIVFHPQAKFQETFYYQGSVLGGELVKVPFGRKEAVGLVWGVQKERPRVDYEIKEILGLAYPPNDEGTIGQSRLLSEGLLKLAHFISKHYFTRPRTVVKTMIPKKVLEPPKRAIKAADDYSPPTNQKEKPPKPTSDQKQAWEKIQKTDKPVLLYGVTGSGKTEIYLRMIEQAIKAGKKVIYLVPEIALTPQLIQRLDRRFPHLRVAIIHSYLGDAKRRDIWWQIKRGEVDIVLGSRSAIFAPLDNLGLIVMDEEHEWSYKQDQAPRYDTHMLALQMQKLTGYRLIMGSATPRVEHFYLAKQGTFELVQLPTRISRTEKMPAVAVVDMRDELKKKNFSPLSEKLQSAIQETLDKKEQVILFLNQRGTARAITCRECGWRDICPHCDITLTYHQKGGKQQLICHYCGYVKTPPDRCPACGGVQLKQTGIGTQRVEKEVAKMFPQAKVTRLDRDSTDDPQVYEQIYQGLVERKIDIVVGTQMIGKGLDLPKVSLVGIVLADTGLFVPDFRSEERTFQVLTQVAGRAGRREPGQVILQTYDPKNEVLIQSQRHDYLSFYQREIANRKKFNYPPFTMLIKVSSVDSSAQKAYQQLEQFYAKIKDKGLCNPPVPSFPPRLANKYHFHLLLRGAEWLAILEKISYSGLRIEVNPV